MTRRALLRTVLGSALAAALGGCGEQRLPELPVRETAGDASVLTLAFGGDVMLGRLMNDFVRREGVLYPWGDVRPLLRAADLTLANLECVIAEAGEPWTRTPKVFHFRADPAAVEVLQAAGIDCVSLANNHSLDFQEAGLLETIERLDAGGIAHAGSGRDLDEARRPAWLEARGLRVAVLSFTDNEPPFAAGDSSPGTNYVEIGPEALTLAQAGIAAARKAGADLVVYSIHWGPNMSTEPSTHFRAFARQVIESGADVFHGHSAHVFQGVEIHRGRPILYDTGDLVDDYMVSPAVRNDLQMLFLLGLSPEGLRWLELVPLHIDWGQVNLATGGDFVEAVRLARERSAPFGAELRLADGRLVVELSGATGGRQPSPAVWTAG